MSLTYNPKLRLVAKMTARDLRKHSTQAEQIFWTAVRNRQFCGWKFLRQHPFFVDYNGRETFFVADFYCAEAGVIVEIDGEVHAAQCEDDTARTVVLQEQGLRVVRFTNTDVLNNYDDVLYQLQRILTPLSSIQKRGGQGG